MNTILIILGVLAVGIAVYYFGFYKQGKINDRDGDYIPDEVEDAVEDVKETVAEVKRRAANVKKELKDVASAIKGKPTKANLNRLTKDKLIEAAKKDFNTDLDPSLSKSNLVNKVYGLYNS